MLFGVKANVGSNPTVTARRKPPGNRGFSAFSGSFVVHLWCTFRNSRPSTSRLRPLRRTHPKFQTSGSRRGSPVLVQGDAELGRPDSATYPSNGFFPGGAACVVTSRHWLASLPVTSTIPEWPTTAKAPHPTRRAPRPAQFQAGCLSSKYVSVASNRSAKSRPLALPKSTSTMAWNRKAPSP
jgi:hypothetical protein